MAMPKGRDRMAATVATRSDSAIAVHSAAVSGSNIAEAYPTNRVVGRSPHSSPRRKPGSSAGFAEHSRLSLDSGFRRNDNEGKLRAYFRIVNPCFVNAGAALSDSRYARKSLASGLVDEASSATG